MKCKKCGHTHNSSSTCVKFDPSLVDGLAEHNLQKLARQRQKRRRS